MGEQGPKGGARAESSGSRGAHAAPGSRAETPSEAPEPTHSQARDRRPEEADTKVERRTSVRPSAFGVPRRSQPPAAPEASPAAPEASPAARREPHERVLEAARLLDAVLYSRAEALAASAAAPHEREVSRGHAAAHFERDACDDVQRLPNQRARGVEPLVARGGAQPGSASKMDGQSAAPAPASVAKARRTASSPSPARSSQVAAAAAPAQRVRAARRPWLSLLLFGGMVALSVVPLLRYAESAEDQTTIAQRLSLARAATGFDQVRAAALSPLPASQALQAPPSSAALSGSEQTAEREPMIAGLLSDGTRALEANDIREAERLFARVLELTADNPHAAYGLARIRLIQNNLSGAEGWIQLALRKRPRRAVYHALYAEVLARMGRVSAARDEQARAGAGRDGDELEP